jgi:hypothetical protein
MATMQAYAPETTSQLMFVNPDDARLEPTRRLQQEDPGTKPVRPTLMVSDSH